MAFKNNYLELLVQYDTDILVQAFNSFFSKKKSLNKSFYTLNSFILDYIEELPSKEAAFYFRDSIIEKSDGIYSKEAIFYKDGDVWEVWNERDLCMLITDILDIKDIEIFIEYLKTNYGE